MPKCLPALPLIALLALSGCQGCGRTNQIVDDGEVSPGPFVFRDYNVVLVSFDALQAAHVGTLGYARNVTPTLDAMAKEGYTFRNAYSVASWTVPASMTWFTGVYPSEHRMTNKFAVYNATVRKPANLQELSPNIITLAEIMKENGYATAGFTGNAGVNGGFGYEQGFDVYHYEQGKFGGLDQSVPRAIAWLEANKASKFFLFLHGYDAHGQNTPATGLDYRFVDKGYDMKFTGSELEQELLREEGLEKGKLTLRDEDVRFWNAVYDEKIQRADEHFKGFMREFDRLGLTGRTVFVLTSDHGTEIYEHRRFDHGFSLYDEQVRVPLFVKLPGHRSGKVISDRVSSIDVMSTVLDLMGVRLSDKARNQLRGTSLVSAMQGTPVARDVFSETDYRAYTFKRSIVTPDGWKLIYTLENGVRELYDSKVDPGETMNRAEAEPAKAAELERRLFGHFEAIGHDLKKKTWKVGLNPVYQSQAIDLPKK